MRLSRLYLPQPLRAGAEFKLNETSAHYVRHVLRLKNGASLIIFNGEGGEYSATIKQATKHGVIIEVGEWCDRHVESALKIGLGLCVSRGERMDFALQKAVELGVDAVSPIISQRTVVQLNDERSQKRRQHWQRIVESACEQCGRNFVPQVAPIQPFDSWLATTEGTKLILDSRSDQTLHQVKRPEKQVVLLSGPEGGFTETERTMAIESEFKSVRLGPRVLRTETAAIAAIAAIQTLWGDLSDTGSA